MSPKSARPNPVKRKVVANRLKDLANDPQRIPNFASSHKLRSKSAKLFKEEINDSRRCSMKHPWTPKPLHSLTATSSQQMGRMELLTKPRERKRDMQAFGRVSQDLCVS